MQEFYDTPTTRLIIHMHGPAIIHLKINNSFLLAHRKYVFYFFVVEIDCVILFKYKLVLENGVKCVCHFKEVMNFQGFVVAFGDED